MDLAEYEGLNSGVSDPDTGPDDAKGVVGCGEGCIFGLIAEGPDPTGPDDENGVVVGRGGGVGLKREASGPTMGRADELGPILWVAAKGEGAGCEGIYARLGFSVPMVSFSQSDTLVYKYYQKIYL